MIVTEIEYGKMSCFTEFGEQVIATLESISMLFKLIGNSGYGGTLVDQLKFMKVQYLEGFNEACNKVTNKRFKKNLQSCKMKFTRQS